MSASKQANAQHVVLSYFLRQNRPYSVQDVFQNMGKDFGKTAVGKVIDSLVAEGKLREKVYGKQKVYVADQKQFPDVNENELKAMDDSISDFCEKIKLLTDETKKCELEIKRLNEMLTTKQAHQSIVQINSEIQSLSGKLSKLRDGQVLISKEEKENLYATRAKFVKEWRKRKRIASDILNSVLEGYPKTKKHLFEDIGIETDEEYNVKPPEI